MVKNAFVLLLSGVAIFMAWRFLSPSEERRIIKMFDKTSELLSKNGGEPIITAAAKARALAELVAPGAHLEIEERNISISIGGEALARQIVIAREQTLSINITFEEISVVFPDEDTALVSADVLFKGTSDLLGFSGRDTRELATTLKRDSSSGDWLFTDIRLKAIVLR